MLSQSHANKRILWIACSLVAAYALIAGAIYLVGRHIERDDNAAADTVGDLSGRFSAGITKTYNGKTYQYRGNKLMNILLIGADRRDIVAQSTQRNGGQADFLLLLCIDRSKKTITPIQLDRDTMTQIQIYGTFGDPAGTRLEQICLAQAFGNTLAQSSENTVSAVEQLLSGIEIDHYLAMDMAGIGALNDALGGVTVTLNDDFSSMDPAMSKGETLTLTGAQAEIFVRGRMNVSDGTNSSRMVRQRAFLVSAFELFAQRMNEDMEFAGNLFDALGDHAGSDMSRGYLINEAYACTKYAQADILTPAGSHTIGTDGFVEFYPDEDALNAMVINVFFEAQNDR